MDNNESTLQPTDSRHNIVVNEAIFHQQMRFAQKHRLSGNLKETFDQYKNAMETAAILENHEYQIDALCQLSKLSTITGDIVEGINYLKQAEVLLETLDYVKGRLGVSLCRIQICYVMQDFVKIREIANEALKLCNGEYPEIRGLIINTMAAVFSEIIEVDEHIDLLQQALKCFEEANDLTGRLGVLNNIAGVYADKIQDKEKALDYYFRIKKLSEENNLVEFSILAHINIGETLLKTLDYEEAAYYIQNGYVMAKAASYEQLIFYSYSLLIEVSLKLNDFTTAFHYFKLAEEELNNHPAQGIWLIQYYSAVSLLLFEVGAIDESTNYVKKAVALSDKYNTMVRWHTGFVYEMIKLREKQNEADIADGLNAVNFIISQLKNPEVKLDKAYDYCIELIHIGYLDHARHFLNEYKDLKYENHGLKMKDLYIQAVLPEDSHSNKQELLLKALDMAISEDNIPFQYRLCCYLGDYYEKIGINLSKVYFNKADSIDDNLKNSIPEQYRK